MATRERARASEGGHGGPRRAGGRRGGRGLAAGAPRRDGDRARRCDHKEKEGFEPNLIGVTRLN